MNALIQQLMGQLSGPALEQVAQKVGATPQATQGAMGMALPLLMQAMSRNASNPQGANALHAALDRDHDGSVLDDLAGFVSGGGGQGGAILNHLLGSQQQEVTQQLAQQSGLAPNAAGTLLAQLAPMLMGVVGKTQKTAGLDPSALAGLLQGMQGGPGGLLGNLNRMLDKDGDGNAMDDVMGMASKLFRGGA